MMNTLLHKPVLIVIAGPNGSGKTSVTSKILHHEWMEDAVYINPDIIAQEICRRNSEMGIANVSRIAHYKEEQDAR